MAFLKAGKRLLSLLVIAGLMVTMFAVGAMAEGEDKQYTVRFDAGEGARIEGTIIQATELIVTVGKKYSDAGAIPKATMDGYTFVGWFLDLEDETTKLEDDAIVQDIQIETQPAQTFYAKFTKNDDPGTGDPPKWYRSGWFIAILIGLLPIAVVGAVVVGALVIVAGLFLSILLLPLLIMSPRLIRGILGKDDDDEDDK